MILGERKQRILAAVVRDYVDTVRPIGSEDLAQRHASWGVKSATIRNELAELSDLGFLRQPHTSSGRIPSDMGYRFYVDHMMDARPVKPKADTIDDWDPGFELDRLLRHTCALLTRMTSYTAVATPPRPADTKVGQIFVSPAGPERLLLVVLLSTGQAENRLLSFGADLSASDQAAVCAAINAEYAGIALDHIVQADPSQPPTPVEFAGGMRSLFELLWLAVHQAVQARVSDDNVVLEGAAEILRQPEFRDASKIEGVLETLRKGTLVLQMAGTVQDTSRASVVIGSENQVTSLHECSVVTAPYFVGIRERGSIGVVGPTRMDYDKAVPAVAFFARTLSQTLTRFTTH
jgi:heat-inducible transcriptional repressor